ETTAESHRHPAVTEAGRLAHAEHPSHELHMLVRDARVQQLVRSHQGSRRHAGNVGGLGDRSKPNVRAAGHRGVNAGRNPNSAHRTRSAKAAMTSNGPKLQCPNPSTGRSTRNVDAPAAATRAR